VTRPISTDASVARASLLSAVMTACGGLLVIGAIIYSSLHVRKATTRVRDLDRRAESLAVLIAKRESTLVQLTPAAAAGLGYANPETVANPSALRVSLTASRAADSLANARNRRQDIAVRYYPRDLERAVNVNIVLPALRAAGFTLIERPAAPAMRNLPTNALWFGADVPIDDVKFVALQLTSAGVQLRAIRPFADPGGPKRKAIEIGADRQQVTASVWTTDRILRAREFPR
jgi:hypothetical protein